MPRRLVQLTAGMAASAEGSTYEVLYGLADDGSSWRLYPDGHGERRTWERLPDLPLPGTRPSGVRPMVAAREDPF